MLSVNLFYFKHQPVTLLKTRNELHHDSFHKEFSPNFKTCIFLNAFVTLPLSVFREIQVIIIIIRGYFRNLRQRQAEI